MVIDEKISKANLILLKMLSQNLAVDVLPSCEYKTKIEILELVEENRMESIFFSYLKKNNLFDEFTESQIKRLAFISNFQIINNKKIFRMVADIAKAFGEKINYAFLKGVALKAINQYENNRPIRDIDILIEEKYIDEAIKILNKLGFEQQFADQSKSDYDYPSLINKAEVKVELHYRILKSNHSRNCELSRNILKNRIKEKLYLQEVYIPEIKEQICHFIYHASIKDYFNSGPHIVSDLKILREVSKLKTEDIIVISEKYKLKTHTQVFFDLIDFICLDKNGHSKTPDNIILLIPGLLLENNMTGEDLFLIEAGNRRKRISDYFKKLEGKGALDKLRLISFRLKRFLETFIKKYLDKRIYSNYKDFKKVKDYLET